MCPARLSPMRRAPIALLFLSAAVCAASFVQSTGAEPLTKDRLLQVLDLLKGDATDALIPQVGQRGVDFDLTEVVERELKAAGASDRLLAVIRKSRRGAGAIAEGQPGPHATLPGTGPAASPGTGPPVQTPLAGRTSSSGASAGTPGGRALVLFYGTCPKGAIVVYNATISANGRELAKLACDSFFYSVATPGAYTFCVNGKKCQTADVKPGMFYYFHVPAKMIGYGLDPVPVRTGDQAVQSLAPLESRRIIAGELVSVDSTAPPAAVLQPGAASLKGGGR